MTATAFIDERPTSGLGHWDVRELNGAPERSLEQRLMALAHANEIRSYRARLKMELKTGRKRVADVLLAPTDEIATMKIYELLLANPKWGRVKAQRAMRFCDISMSKTISGLSPRQRQVLVRMVGR